MSSQGPNGTGTGANDASIGTVVWNNPTNITADDASFSTTSSLGFPGAAVIRFTSVKAVKGGTISGTDQQDNAGITATDTFYTYGGSSNLWGLSWTDTDINASNFGFVASMTNDGTAVVSNYIKATNFGFSIPSGATIDGLVVEFKMKNTSTCFPAGTLISTPNGEIPIENIKVGDMVKAFNNDGKIYNRKVVAIKDITKSEKIYTIKTSNGNVSSTPKHRYFTQNNEFIEAEKLNVGDCLFTTNGYSKIVEIVIDNRAENVYNFEVEDLHTYFANGFGVHNFKTSAFFANCNYVRATIYYTTAGGSLIKTKKGLAQASVKTFKGLAIASLKTDKGLTNV